MVNIKGVSILEWWLTKWLAAAGFPMVKAKLGSDFLYCSDNSIIYFSLFTTETHDLDFLHFAQDEFNFPFDCDNFILSFFHELGHYMTYHEWSQKELNEYYLTKLYLSLFENSHLDYYKLPIEHLATDWACSYICNHQKEIEEFWRVCKKLLMNIYKQNNLMED